MMGPVSFGLLLLAARCYCAPGSWLDIGGKLGYESNINGTIGGHLKANRDGLSVSGSTGGILGASWNPTVHAIGHASLGDKIIAADGSFSTNIDNSWQPTLHGEIGHNSKGEWLLGAQPVSVLKNKLLLSPRLQVQSGDDARKLAGLPITASENKDEATQQAMVNGGVANYAPAYPYGYYPYGYQYGSYPYAPMANAAPYPYNTYPYTASGATYGYAQGVAQPQVDPSPVQEPKIYPQEIQPTTA